MPSARGDEQVVGALLYVHGVAHEAAHAHAQVRLDRTRISRSFAQFSP